MANERASLGLHSQCWWSKKSKINKRKMFSEEIHHLEEVRYIATAIGQGNKVYEPSGRMQKTELSHGATSSTWYPPKIKFHYKGSLQRFSNTSQPTCLGWLLVGFYGISTFIGHLTPNPFLCKGWVHNLSKTFLFQAIQFSQTVEIQLIQFSISTGFIHTQLNVKTVLY